MESEEPAAFRPNLKVGIMVLLTMTALFVPLLCIAWLARGYFQPKPAVVAETAGLRDTIERSADEALPARPIADDRPALTAPVGQTAESLRGIAEPLGASVIELEEGRFLVSGPAGTLAAFAKVLNVEPPAGEDEELFEIKVETPIPREQ